MEELRDKKSNVDSIDVLLFVKRIWIERIFILKITAIFMFTGFCIAILSKNVYTASTTFIPVEQGSGNTLKGGIGGLASFAGINLGLGVSNSTGISPQLYPQIIDNISFKKELLKTELTIDGVDSLVTYEEFYQKIYNPGFISNFKKYTLGFPRILKSLFKKEDSLSTVIHDSQTLIVLSDDEYLLTKKLEKQIKLSVNDKEGFISLSVSFPQSIASSELTLKVRTLLQSYIMDIKTQKSKNELKFLMERFAEKEKEMNESKIRLAKFKDENTSIYTSVGRSQLIDLQSKYNLAFDVYSELAKKIETQLFQVKKDTPIFTILNPVTIPLEKSAPNRLLIFLTYSLFGVFLGIGFILFRIEFNVIRNNWNSN